MFVFLTYLPVFSLKFRLGEIVGWRIKFRIQRVPMLHTFDGPRYPKNKKYLKKCDDDTSSHFSGISCFWGSGVRQKYAEWVLVGCGIHPTSSPNWNLSKNTGIYVENTDKKVVFFFSSLKINKYYFIILLNFFRRPILSWNLL